MSSGFEKVLLQDGRLNSTPDIKFGVLKGAQSLSSSKYPASAVSSNSAVWNIQVPSQSTMVDTHVLLKSKLRVTVTGATTIDDTRLVNYGKDTAFAAFPCHQFMTNVSATINSNQVSVNMNDVLETIIRSLPKHELAAFEGMCPVLSDNVYSYDEYNAGENNNVLSAYQQTSTENYLHPNGSHIVSISGNTAGVAGNKTVILEIETVEPLLFSPFTFARMNSCEGALYGITSMNFNFSFGNIGRILRSSKALTVTTVEFVGNPELEFFYLTPHPSQAKNMNARNIHKFYKFDRIITSGQDLNVVSGKKKTLTTQTTQLNSVPDKIFLFAKFKASGGAGCRVPDRHIPIKKININFNNISGLCSNFSQAQLYQCSRETGIQQSWLEWSGLASVGGDATSNTAINTIQTAGPILGLNFAEHISLVEDYLAPNSLGNYNLQIDVDLENYGGDIAGDSYELYLVTMNSGILSIDKGSSAVYSALLSAEDVLKASDMEPISKPTVERFIGGSVFDQIRSALPKVLPVARAVLEQIPHPYAQASSAALKSMGYAKLSDRMK